MKLVKVFALACAVVAMNARAEVVAVEEPKEEVTLIAKTEQGEEVKLTISQNEAGELVVKEADIAC